MTDLNTRLKGKLVSSVLIKVFRNPMPKITLMRSYDRAKVAIDGLLRGDGLKARAMRGGTWLGGGKRCGAGGPGSAVT